MNKKLTCLRHSETNAGMNKQITDKIKEIEDSNNIL